MPFPQPPTPVSGFDRTWKEGRSVSVHKCSAGGGREGNNQLLLSAPQIGCFYLCNKVRPFEFFPAKSQLASSAAPEVLGELDNGICQSERVLPSEKPSCRLLVSAHSHLSALSWPLPAQGTGSCHCCRLSGLSGLRSSGCLCSCWWGGKDLVWME